MAQQRHEMYRPIHKAIRHMMYTTAHDLSVADYQDKPSADGALASLESTISLLVLHAGHEEDYVHTALEERAPGFIESFEKEHGNDELVYAQLRKLSNEVGSASGARKSELGNEIYDIYNQFVGAYISHLYREEHELQQALWDNFTDEELGAIEGAIDASVAPDVMGQFIILICASFNPDDLVSLLGVMKGGMPPEVFQGVVGMCQSATPADIWAKVKDRI
ncbi:MAG: hemerythrin domain-containing protein [Chloroflexi bacterium]|nr:hemerythrin domain-containing protein [Chloroflexota bacterium]